MKQAALVETPQGLLHAMEETKYGNQEKKKRLTSNQIESLERSFQDEIKLDTDRKMKLSRELGLQPRQIAVWFQNRRTRWKAKQLEHLYLALKQEFDHISKEKQKLQEEVVSFVMQLLFDLNWTCVVSFKIQRPLLHVMFDNRGLLSLVLVVLCCLITVVDVPCAGYEVEDNAERASF